jgi:hypothetical protein
VKRLSIVVPAYNEERFIGTLLERIRAVDLAPLALKRKLSSSTTARKMRRRRLWDGSRMWPCAVTRKTPARGEPSEPGSRARAANI